MRATCLRILLAALVGCATARICSAQEQTHQAIEDCTRAVDDLCDPGVEGYFGNSLPVDPVRWGVNIHFPPCAGSTSNAAPDRSNCRTHSVTIPKGMRMSKIAITVSDGTTGSGCAVWKASSDGTFPILGKQNQCSPQTDVAWEQPQVSRDGRTVTAVLRNWSGNVKAYGYLRVYYVAAR
jgi:hypothetical protein